MDSEDFGRFPVRIDIPVAWGDMDANRHVNNTVFVRWFESARIAYLAQCPALMAAFEAQQHGPTLRRQEIDYQLSVTYPDTVTVSVSVTELRRTSFTMACTIDSERLAVRVATAAGTMVMLDFTTGTPIPVPDAIRHDFVDLEATGDV